MEANLLVRTIESAQGKKLEIVQGDITRETVGAIVNAANSQLIHGGGVAGAIARRGGPRIQAESNTWVREHGPVLHANPAYTTAGELSSQYVIHAVGPVWGEGDEVRKLREAVTGSLQLANQLGLESVAMPAISTGIYSFPVEKAARVILDTVRQYFSTETGSSLRVVRVVVFDRQTAAIFLDVIDES